MGKEHWYWLAAGLGWGAVNTGELLAAFPGGAEEIADDLGSERLDELVTQKQADRLTQSRPADFALRVAHAEAQGVATLGYGDEEYPAALRPIHNPPPALFVKGDVSLLNGQLAIGIVGTRRPSAYGAEAVKAVGRGVALGGAIIVSGLAAGLDAEAHKAALAVNGPTIACIAFGHDHCYPAANRKLMEVIERCGAVVSEYPLGTGPEKPYFLQRNRLIAGISHGLCVVEARRHSGTMSTANFASDFGRDVFAVPGSIFSELSGGTNAMIREGAYLAGSASDILSVYGIALKEEDPVETAAKQAREGRPAPAGAAPPWQQSLRRRAAQEKAAGGQPPGQQALGEGSVSAAAAVDAFRAAQKHILPAAGDEADAGSAALNARAAAVSDSVELSAPAKRKARLFPWDKVERLGKTDVEDLSPARQERSAGRDEKKPAKPRTPGANAAKGEEAAGRKDGQRPPGAGGPVNAAGAALAAEPAPPRPAGKSAPAAPPLSAANGGEEQVRQAPPPVPAAERPEPGARADAALQQRLQTLRQTQRAMGGLPQKPPPPKPPLPKIPLTKPPRMLGEEEPAAPMPSAFAAQSAARPPAEREGGDARERLSDVARRAYGQLGAKPMSLAAICERSGLSPAETMAALTELELAGLSRQLPGRQFVIMQ